MTMTKMNVNSPIIIIILIEMTCDEKSMSMRIKREKKIHMKIA